MIYKVKPGSGLKEMYMATNPEYVTRLKQELWIGDTPKKVFLGSTDGRYYPPGVVYFANKAGNKAVVYKEKPHDHEFGVKLWDHQLDVFNEIKDHRSGLIELKTGSGKSILAAEIARYHGGKVLIALHSVEMLGQFAEMYQTKYGIKVAQYGDGKKELGDVTLTTFSSAVKQQEVFQTHGFDTLIIDECDRFFTQKARNFVCTFACRWKYGFTGTTNSKYGKGALELFWGPRATASNNNPDPVKHLYRSVFRDEEAPTDPKDWQKMREHLDNSNERLQHILRDVEATYKEGDYYLVLLDRTAHVEWMYEGLTGFQGPLYKNHGKLDNDYRDSSIEGFKENGGILIAQYQTTGRGFDAPECNKIYLGFPTKDETNLRQIVGRASRYVEGKESTLYDLVDYNLWFQFRKREKIYKEFWDLEAKPLYQ